MNSDSLTPSQEEIALHAYHLFLQGGCQHGRDEEYWLQAEKELGAKFFVDPAESKEDAEPAAKAPAKKAAAKKAAAKKAPAAKKEAAVKKAPAKKAAKKKASE